MKQLLNFVPLIFFFSFLMIYDIFAGVQALMISATICFVIICVLYKKVEKMELFSYLMIMVFGAMTLYFRDQNIIKWKVTIINFLFFKKNLIQRILGKEIQLDSGSWNKLNTVWVIFFIICGLANLYVTYYTSDDFFGVFKAFILPGASLVLTAISGIYIYKKISKMEHQS